MKKIISMAAIIALFFLPVQLSAQENSGKLLVLNDGNALVKWDKTEMNLGTLKLNHPVDVDFTLTNIGKTPLVIKEVKTSCGCTVASYTQEPVLPGNSTTITAKYNAKSPGGFHKSVTILMNTEEGSQLLVLKGNVE